MTAGRPGPASRWPPARHDRGRRAAWVEPAGTGRPPAAWPMRPGFLTRLRRDALRALAAGPLYRHTLIGRGARRSAAQDRASAGRATPSAAQRSWPARSNSPASWCATRRRVWFPPGAGPEWLAAWHGFGWLADLISVGGDGARRGARAGAELARRERRLAPGRLALRCAWRPGSSPGSCISTSSPGATVDRALRRAMLASLAAQLRHLARTAAWEVRRRGAAARAQRADRRAGRARRLGASASPRALRALERELPVQILPDGGHRSRSPSVQLAGIARPDRHCARHCAPAQIEVPAGAAGGDRAHGADAAVFPPRRPPAGAVQQFGRGGRGPGRPRPDPLGDQGPRRRRRRRIPAFERLQAGQSLVLVDTGKPPPRGFDDEAHAGTLSFELSQGRERIIVNCGGYRGPKPAWRRVARASAAHSVLVVADTNSVEIRADGSLGRTPGRRCAASAPRRTASNGSRRPMTAIASASA